MALSKIDLANQVENDLPQNLIANNVPFRNIIINGDMSLAQRATSQASITDDGYYTVDRFKTFNDTLGTWTQSQSTDVPTGQGFAKSLKMDCTTADASPASGDRLGIRQQFEGQNLQYLKFGTSSAESLTLSFWVKSNKTGTYIAELYEVTDNRQISKSYTISSADTWEKKTITFVGDTTGVFGNDISNELIVSWFLGAGSNYTSGTLSTTWTSSTNANRAVGQVNLADSTSNEFYITGVQLEAGTSASDFEFLPHDVNLQRCQRYFEKIFNIGTTPANQVNDTPYYGGINGWVAWDSSNVRTLPISFKTTKRANPSITIYSGASGPTNGQFGILIGGTWTAGGNTVPNVNTNGFYGAFSSGSSFTQNNAYLLDCGWTADSEL